MRPLGEVIGFLAPRSPSSFPPGCSSISTAVPDHPEKVGSSTRAVAPLQSAPSLARRTSLSGASRGVLFPLRDINPAHRSSGVPTPPRLPSSAVHTPSTASSAPGLAGLLHPAATSRVLPSGAFPPAQPYRLVGGRALSPLTVARCRRFDPSAPRVPAPTSGPSSTREPVVRPPGFSRRSDPIPSWASPPPGVSPRTPRTG